jgi:hypothetical protein
MSFGHLKPCGKLQLKQLSVATLLWQLKIIFMAIDFLKVMTKMFWEKTKISQLLNQCRRLNHGPSNG